MMRIVACGAGITVCLLLLCQGAAAQPAPSSDDMIKALTAPGASGTSRGFRLNHGATPPAAAEDQSGRPHGATLRHASSAHREIGVPLLFDVDSATMKPDSAPMLASIVKALQSPQLADTHILLEGHTDASGNPAHNLVLSQQRADAVRAALVQDGVDAARLSTKGKGQSEPANPANPLAAENRRVVLVNPSN